MRLGGRREDIVRLWRFSVCGFGPFALIEKWQMEGGDIDPAGGLIQGDGRPIGATARAWGYAYAVFVRVFKEVFLRYESGRFIEELPVPPVMDEIPTELAGLTDGGDNLAIPFKIKQAGRTGDIIAP